MLGWVTNKTEYLAKKFVQTKILQNSIYAHLKWNPLERLIIRLSSTPVISAFCLLCAALVMLIAGFLLKFPIREYLSSFFPYRHSVLEWQTTILSGQLTIIGIVYPLVIGLVSVVFQKKSDRKVAQSAYQRYSGFMLAGLSGLFLSAFILLSVPVRMIFGDYLYGIACLTSAAWLTINILLSVWFFIVSLEVLDDDKRQAVVKRYISFGIVRNHVNEKVAASLRLNPVYPQTIFSNLEIKLVDNSVENQHVSGKFLKTDVLSLYHRPFRLALRLINKQMIKNGSVGHLTVGNNYISGDEVDKKVLFGLRNIDSESYPVRLLKKCFYKVKDRRSLSTSNTIMQPLTADIYSCLRDSDINGFDDASGVLIDNFTTLCELYYFQNNDAPDNFLLLKSELFEISIQDAFSNEIYSISAKAMDKIAESERFFELCLWTGLRILNNRKLLTTAELGIYMGITRSFWSTLTIWYTQNQPLSSVTLRTRYDRLLRTFTSIWERHQDVVSSRFCNADDAELFDFFCKAQLQDISVMVIEAIQTRDRVTTDMAVDLLNRWQHSMNIDSHTIEKYSYQGQLFSPGIFIIKHMNCITDRDWFSIACMNALIDMRICVSLYLTSRMKAQDKFITHFVRLILQGDLTDQTGGLETKSEKIDDGGELIKSLIRICLWTWSEKMESRAWLTGLARRMSDYEKPDMVSGRLYSGIYDRGFIDMPMAWAQLLLVVSGESSQISKDVKEAIEDDYITYREKQHLLGVLSGVHKQLETLECPCHLNENEIAVSKANLNSLLGQHIDLLKQNLYTQLKEAVIDASRLAVTAAKTSEYLTRRLQKPVPLSLFRLTRFVKSAEGFTERRPSVHIKKESYAEGIDAIAAANEGDFQAECIVSDIQRIAVHKLLHSAASRQIFIEDFNMLLDNIKASSDFSRKYVLVMSKEIFQQYNNLIFAGAELHRIMKINRDGSRTVTTHNGDCHIFFMPFVNQPCSLVVDEDFFSALSLREFESGNLVEITSENVRSDSDRFDLILMYQADITFKGSPSIRIEHPKRSDTD